MSGVQPRHIVYYYIMLCLLSCCRVDKKDRDRIVSGAQHELFSDGKRQGHHVGVKHRDT